MNFLLENERGYAGAATLYEKLARLKINPTLYELPQPYIFKPDEVLFWTDSLLNELRGLKVTEEVQYIQRVCSALRKWANDGHIIHVR